MTNINFWLFVPCLILCAYTDIRWKRVNNKVLAVFFALMLYQGRTEIRAALEAAAVCLMCGLLLEARNIWQAGDTKLLALCGGWAVLAGIPLLRFGAACMVVYAAVGLIMLIKQAGSFKKFIISRQVCRLPGAAVIAAGFVLCGWWSQP